jgi:hypothetical protein
MFPSEVSTTSFATNDTSIIVEISYPTPHLSFAQFRDFRKLQCYFFCNNDDRSLIYNASASIPNLFESHNSCFVCIQLVGCNTSHGNVTSNVYPLRNPLYNCSRRLWDNCCRSRFNVYPCLLHFPSNFVLTDDVMKSLSREFELMRPNRNAIFKITEVKYIHCSFY